MLPRLVALLLATTWQSATMTETDAIRRPLAQYAMAHATGDSAFIRDAFSAEARIRSLTDGKVSEISRTEFESRFNGLPAADEHRRVRRLERLDVTGNAAAAKLTLAYPEVKFTDYVSLLRFNDGWKIVSKTFVAEPALTLDMMIQRLGEANTALQPMRIAGNLFHVGGAEVSVFLFDTGAGLILVDAGMPGAVPQLEKNIMALGFRMENIKLVLNTHAHIDHAGAFAELKQQIRAQFVSSSHDAEALAHGGTGDFHWGDSAKFPLVVADRIVRDGESITLGSTTLTAMMTPGHTKGCTTWRTQVRDDDHVYDVAIVCAIVASPYKLVGNDRYPEIVGDMRRSFDRLRSLHADILLAPHGAMFGLAGKLARLGKGPHNPFIDTGELGRHLRAVESEFDASLRHQQALVLPR